MASTSNNPAVNYRLRWKPANRLLRSQVPTSLLDWLLDSASLTRRLQEACSGRFEVRLLEQGWDRPFHDECRALGTSRCEQAFVRRVELLCDGVPWVYARTVIPTRSLTGCNKRLANLGTRPLGAVLFADPSMRRSALQTGHLTPGMKLFDDASQHLPDKPAELWGRRSIFWLHHKPLLVAEVFLPPLKHCPRGLVVHYHD